MVRFHMIHLAAGCALASALAYTAAGDEPSAVTITTSKDNTLIQTTSGELSLGAAPAFYAGRVGSIGGGTLRRGLIAFDIASALPEGAEIIEVELALHMSITQAGNQTITLRRMLADWGEGESFHNGGWGDASTPGDATWLHRFWPDVYWGTPGGDFSDVISASQLVGPPDWYTWESTPQLVADVQSWLDAPETNFGWLVRGGEHNAKTVKRFDSRFAAPEKQPQLTITYIAPEPKIGDLNGDGVVDVFDLLILLAEWGECADPDGCRADLEGSGVVNVFDLLILLGNWG